MILFHVTGPRSCLTSSNTWMIQKISMQADRMWVSNAICLVLQLSVLTIWPKTLLSLSVFGSLNQLTKNWLLSLPQKGSVWEWVGSRRNGQESGDHRERVDSRCVQKRGFLCSAMIFDHWAGWCIRECGDGLAMTMSSTMNLESLDSRLASNER